MGEPALADPQIPAPTGPPAVSVVIVTYKGATFIADCLAYVARQTFRDFEVVLVENASNDGTVELIKRAFPAVRLIVNEENRGFTGGVNAGVSAARSDIVVLLNNDGKPEPGWLAGLVRRLPEAQPGDLITSVVINEGTNEEAMRNGWTLNILGRSHRNPSTPPDFQFFGAGAGMLFRKSTYDPPFPEPYFIYQEDTYLGWKARITGNRVLVSMDSRVFHAGSATMKKLPFLGAYHGEKNRLTNDLVFWERATLMRLAPLMLVDFLFHFRRHPEAYAKALGYVVSNRRSIRRERAAMQKRRAVPDRAILKFTSATIAPNPGLFNELANRLALSWCRAFGLRTLELEETFSPNTRFDPMSLLADPAAAP